MEDRSKFLPEMNIYFTGFYDGKEYSKFIKAVERLIRKDRSYLTYIKKIKEFEEGVTRDVVLNNLRSGDVTIEMHHHPLTLYDIVSIVALHNFNNDVDFTSFSLAKEVLKAHYDNIIGLSPMSTTTHQLAHLSSEHKSKDRMIQLTDKQVFGKYKVFVEKYKDGLTLETREKLQLFEKISAESETKIDQLDIFKEV